MSTKININNSKQALFGFGGGKDKAPEFTDEQIKAIDASIEADKKLILGETSPELSKSTQTSISEARKSSKPELSLEQQIAIRSANIKLESDKLATDQVLKQIELQVSLNNLKAAKIEK